MNRIFISLVACTCAAILIYIGDRIGSSTTTGTVLLNFSASMADIVITVAIIDALLERREKKHWKPARQIIMRHVAKTYAELFNSCYQLFMPLIRPEVMRHYQKSVLEFKHDNLKQIQRQIEKLQRTLDLNNAALDAFLTSHISEFLERTEKIENRFRFLMDIYHPDNSGIDFICDDLCDHLKEMDAVAAKLKKEYPEIWRDRNVIPEWVKPLDEIASFIKSAEYPKFPIFFSPEKYKLSHDRTPRVLNVSLLRKISTSGAEVGITVQVFQHD